MIRFRVAEQLPTGGTGRVFYASLADATSIARSLGGRWLLVRQYHRADGWKRDNGRSVVRVVDTPAKAA